jgi:transposase
VTHRKYLARIIAPIFDALYHACHMPTKPTPPVHATPPILGDVADPAITTHRLGHLPILMAYLRKMRVIEIIDEACPVDGRSLVSHGQCVAVILCGVFVGVHSLWRVAERLRPFDMVTIMQDPKFNLNFFHDDRLGAALDALYWAGLDGLMTRLAVGIIDHFSIKTQYLRFDTTAFALQGDYASEDPYERFADVAPPPKIVRGYSKDHRPDLKQVMFGMLVADDGGIPLMGGMLSGNSADSRVAADFFRRIREVVRDPREVVCIGDCKSWCLPVLARCQEDGLRLLSRLPRHHGLHATVLAAEGPVQTVEVAGEICEYLGMDVTESGLVSITADDESITRQAVTVPARAVRVFSPALLHTKRATLDRSRKRERKQAGKEIASMQGINYACEIDARNDAILRIDELGLDYLVVHVKSVTRYEGPVKRPVGRPRKGQSAPATTLATEYWRVTYAVTEVDATAIEAHLRAQATFVLIRTRDAAWTIDDGEMIPAYRRQFVIEQGFSWLKSTAVINPMYLHTPHRIASLGFIYCVGLMAWNLIQRNVRSYLKSNQLGLPYHHKKKWSDNITTRFLFEIFASLGTATQQFGNHRTKHLVNAHGWIYLALQALGISEEFIKPILSSGGNNYTGNS